MGRFSSALNKNQHSPSAPLNCSSTLFRSILLSALAITFGLPTKSFCRELIDRIVAEVNSNPILASEIEEKISKGPLVKISDYPASESSKPFNRALQDSINTQLVASRAESLNIEISEEDIDQQIERVLEQNRVDLPQLKQFLAAQGKDYDEYRSDIKDQILFMRFRGRVLMPAVKITDRDIETYYLKKSGGKSNAAKLVIKKIFFSVPQSSQQNFRLQKQALAEEVYTKLVNGLNFNEAEKIYSELPENQAPMKVALKDLDKNLQETISPLNIKEFSKPTIFGNGIYIFYIEEKNMAENEEFTKKRAELEFELRQIELIEQLKRWIKEERQKSKIRIIES